jgi:Protein of unknown function (DUF3754)
LPRFIPCRTSHLVEELSLLFPDEERPAFWELARVVEDLYHHYGSSQARVVADLYAPFDPDAETKPQALVRGPDPLGRLYERLEEAFERANFNKAAREMLLTRGDRDVLLKLKLDPDLESLEQVAVYYRGQGSKAATIRPASNLFRIEEREVSTYRRVAIVVRTVDQPYVLLKMFKDVPRHDLELLLPTVRVKMKLFDKLKLSGSGGAAALSAWKLLRQLYTYTPTLAKFLTVPFKMVVLPVMLVVGGIYGGKTLLDYSKIKASYVTAMAEHLYQITIASNLSVVSRLSAMAGEEDTKEVLVAYAILRSVPRPGLTPEELQARAEAFLWDRYRARIRFDVEDALSKLDDLAITWHAPGGERRSSLPIDAALRNLDRSWDEIYSAPARSSRRAARPARGAVT